MLAGADLPSDDGRLLLEIVDARWPGMVRGDLPRGADQCLSICATPATPDRFAVYDARGTLLGGPESLAGIRITDVRALRRLTDIEERAAFGHRHPAGAIVVTWAVERAR